MNPIVSMCRNGRSIETQDSRAVAVVEAIRSSRWQGPVGLIRARYERVLAETGNPVAAKDAVTALKLALPCIMWSGNFTTRAGNVELLEKLNAPSGLLNADMDGLTPQQIAEARAQFAADPHVFATFLSPTGTGLKVVFRVPADIEQHAASFQAVQEHVRQLCGIEIDAACRDVTRLCFVSHDPNAFLNRDAVELVPSPVDPNLVGKANNTKTHDQQTDRALPPTASRLLATGAEAGERNTQAFKLACQLRDAGYDQDAAGKLVCEFAGRCRPPLSKDEALSATKSAYARPPREPAVTTLTIVPKSEYSGEEPEQDEGADTEDAGSEKEGTVAECLVELMADVPLFCDDEGTAYAEVRRNKGYEVFRVRSGRFAEWLAAEFYRKYRRVARRSAIDDARAVISGEAQLRGVVLPVYIRVGGNDHGILLDIGDDARRIIVITRDGWTLTTDCHAKFLRPTKALALPEPRIGGDLSLLWRVLNVRERDRVLCVAWLLSSLQPKGPFFLANFVGQQGAGKSCACRVMRNLVDPSSVPLRRGTTEERSLWVAAANNRVLAFENLSEMRPWLSDALCALATGGGYSSRALFTDGDEAAFNAQRPVLLNGIADVVARPDLAERTLRIELDPIPRDRRRTETDLNRELAAIAPNVLGALLDAVAFGLSRLDSFHPPELPRMADAARWVEACLPKLGFKEGDFLAALDRHERETADSTIEGSAVARAVISMLDDCTEWTGPAKELLARLRSFAPEAEQRTRNWPESPRSLSGALRRIAPVLRHVEIEVVEPRVGDKTRKWRLYKKGVHATPPKPPEPPAKASEGDGVTGDKGGSGDSSETPSTESEAIRV